MKELDVEGVFWPAARPDEQVAGRMTFGTSTGAELALIGSFGSLDEILSERNEPIRILGVAGKRVLTLDDCLRAGSTFETPGVHRERYRPATVLAGAHFDEGEALTFSAVAVQVRHLSHWVRRSGVELSLTEEADDITQIRLTHTPIATSTIETSLGEVELGSTWAVRGDHVVESTIEQGCYLRLRPPEPTTMEELVKACLAVQHLVTLGTDTTAPITSLSFWHPDVTRTLSSGRVVHESIELYARLQGGDVPSEARTRHAHDMLFTLDDLGGVAAVARWLEVSSTFEAVVAALLSHRYMPKMYAENRLQNVVFACETFDRIRFPNRLEPKAGFRRRVSEVMVGAPKEHKPWLRDQLQYSNEPRLRQRLLRLADHAGAAFATLVGDVDGWADAVKDARNRSVHRSTSRSPVDGISLHLLSESAYFLVALCLLRECGASAATLAKIQEHQRLLWLAGQIGEDRARSTTQASGSSSTSTPGGNGSPAS
jgi:hypothetical protein